MPVIADTRSKIHDVAQRLAALMEDGVWKEDLEVGLAVQEFSGAQIEAMKAAASPTCRNNFNALAEGSGEEVQEKISEILTHAFRDPVLKAAMYLTLFGEGKIAADDPHKALLMVTQARDMMREVVHNYPLLLGEEMPGSVRDILDAYEREILPELEEAVAAFSAESGVDPSAIPVAVGWEHLHALPPEIF